MPKNLKKLGKVLKSIWTMKFMPKAQKWDFGHEITVNEATPMWAIGRYSFPD